MAIYQSSNLPLIIDFNEDMSNINDILITLYTKHPSKSIENNQILKKWTKADVEIVDTTIIAPLTQQETASFQPGDAYLEAKWLDENGYTVFSDSICIEIKYRQDKTVMGV